MRSISSELRSFSRVNEEVNELLKEREMRENYNEASVDWRWSILNSDAIWGVWKGILGKNLTLRRAKVGLNKCFIFFTFKIFKNYFTSIFYLKSVTNSFKGFWGKFLNFKGCENKLWFKKSDFLEFSDSFNF